MARFDVYEIKRTISRYVVDVQADLLVSLGTRVVVPLLPPSLMAAPIRDLNPAVTIGTETFLFHPQLILTIPRQALRRHVSQLTIERDDITRALDILLTGF